LIPSSTFTIRTLLIISSSIAIDGSQFLAVFWISDFRSLVILIPLTTPLLSIPMNILPPSVFANATNSFAISLEL